MEKVLRYLNDEIVPLNDKNDAAHNSQHVLKVMERSKIFAAQDKKDVNMAVTAGAFHDLGYSVDPENHGLESANILKRNSFVCKNFTYKQVKIMADAIEDHDAKVEFRNPYSEVLHYADKRIGSAEEWVEMSFANLYKRNPNWSIQEFVKDIRSYALNKIQCYNKSSNRFVDVEQDGLIISLKALCERPDGIQRQVMSHLFAAREKEKSWLCLNNFGNGRLRDIEKKDSN